jgi:hypothetical protein
MPTLQETIRRLYEIAVGSGATQSPQRLGVLASYCIEQLAVRGLANAQGEQTLPGGAREKNWDVAWFWQGKVRLAISLKSILQNVAGTVPNRIDDLIGETANLQMFSPEVVVGYLLVFDVSKDQFSPKHNERWLEVLQQRLGKLTGREMPSWGVGMIEASCIVQVDFSREPTLLSNQSQVDPFFDVLVKRVRERNPGS